MMTVQLNQTSQTQVLISAFRICSFAPEGSWAVPHQKFGPMYIVYINTNTYASLQTYIHTYINTTYVPTDKQTGRQAGRQTDRQTYTYVYMYTHTYIHLRVYLHLIHTHVRIHVGTYLNIPLTIDFWTFWARVAFAGVLGH